MGNRVRRSFLAGGWLVLVCAWAGVGCVQPRDSRFYYFRGESPKPLIRAPEAGVYTLYQTDSTAPRFSVNLAPGDLYGFRLRVDDSVVAVAKEAEVELGDQYFSGYYWIAPHKEEPVRK